MQSAQEHVGDDCVGAHIHVVLLGLTAHGERAGGGDAERRSAVVRRSDGQGPVLCAAGLGVRNDVADHSVGLGRLGDHVRQPGPRQYRHESAAGLHVSGADELPGGHRLVLGVQ